MTLKQLKTLLETTGYPVAYDTFKAPQERPFICYIATGSNNFAADGHVYATAAKVQVELYTAAKDQAAEEKVEQALSSMYWDKSETVLEDDHAYEVIYQIEV